MSSFREIAHGLSFPEGPVSLPDGSLLVVEIAAGRLTKIDLGGKKTVVTHLKGGPNGAAIGPDGRVYICNNGGMRFFEKDGCFLPRLSTLETAHGWIEAVDLKTGQAETIYTECDGNPLIGPNDLVFDSSGGFWFTDHGHTRRRDKDRGSVYYAQTDGSEITEVISPLDGPNGIGISPDEKQLYVAETPTGRIWAFNIEAPGKISRTAGPVPWEKGQLIASPSGYHLFDSLALDSAGNICVGSIPGAIDVFSQEGDHISSIPLPDTFPTNICFGGTDLKTAYVTLSSSGILIALDWPRPGLRLHF